MKKGLLEKIILAGMGAASITQDKVEKLVDELVKEGEMSDKDAAVMAKRAVDNIEKSRKEMEKKTEAVVKQVIGKINVPTRKDVQALEKQIAELNKRLDASKKAEKK